MIEISKVYIDEKEKLFLEIRDYFPTILKELPENIVTEFLRDEDTTLWGYIELIHIVKKRKRHKYFFGLFEYYTPIEYFHIAQLNLHQKERNRYIFTYYYDHFKNIVLKIAENISKKFNIDIVVRSGTYQSSSWHIEH